MKSGCVFFPQLTGAEQFDAEFYRRLYHDVAIMGADPWQHYQNTGKAEGRYPNAASMDFLDEGFYSAMYPDVAESGLEPKVHYICKGWQQGRLANKSALDFDSGKYLSAWPDIHRALADPLKHFLLFGIQEGRHIKHPFRQPCKPGHGVKVLVADKRVVEYDRSAGERATWFTMLTLIKLGFEVSYLPWLAKDYYARYADEMRALGINLILPENYTDNWHKQWLRKHAASFRLFYLYRPEVANDLMPVIRKAAPGAKIIYHAPDLAWLRELREAELSGNEDLRNNTLALKSVELGLMAESDTTVVVSDEEKKFLLAENPSLNVASFKVLYSEIVEEQKPFWQRRDFFFIGGGRHRPNTDAALWFAHEIWPLIRQSIPEAFFHIIGPYLAPEVEKLNGQNNIVVEGFVQELEPKLASYRVGVAPLRFGAGIKGKVALMLGSGIPAVCTAMAAEGMDLENEKGALIAEEAADFAAACVRLYSSPELWQRMAKAGIYHIEQNFGIAANDAELTEILWQQGLLPPSSWLSSAALPTFNKLPILSERPEISIIIASHSGDPDIVRRCILAIINHTQGSNWELFLAGDAEAAGLRLLAEFFPGITIVLENGGVPLSINKAATLARGKYLCLVEEDTIVMAGWLDLLGEDLITNPTAGAAFARQIFAGAATTDAENVEYTDRGAVLLRRDYWRGLQPCFSLSPFVLQLHLADSMAERGTQLIRNSDAMVVRFRKPLPLISPPKDGSCEKLHTSPIDARHAIYLLPQGADASSVALATNRCDSLTLAGFDVQMQTTLHTQCQDSVGGGNQNFGLKSTNSWLLNAGLQDNFNIVLCSFSCFCDIARDLPYDVIKIVDFEKEPEWDKALYNPLQANLAAFALLHAHIILAQTREDKNWLEKIGVYPEKIIFLPPYVAGHHRARMSSSLNVLAAIVDTAEDLRMVCEVIYNIHRNLFALDCPFVLNVACSDILHDAASPWEKHMLRLPWVRRSVPEGSEIYEDCDAVLLISRKAYRLAEAEATRLPVIKRVSPSGKNRKICDIAADIFDLALDPARFAKLAAQSARRLMLAKSANATGMSILKRRLAGCSGTLGK